MQQSVPATSETTAFKGQAKQSTKYYADLFVYFQSLLVSHNVLQPPAQPGAVLNDFPPLGTRRRDGVKDTKRVPLPSESLELRILCAPEVALPVTLIGIGL